MEDQHQQARQFTADGMRALQAGDGAAADAALRRAIDLGWPGPDVWVALSFAKSRLGDMEGRIAALQKALDVDPASVRARLHLGQALVGAERPDEARPHFEKGLADSKFLTETNVEIDQLIQAASSFLGQPAPGTDAAHPVDTFAREHDVGSEPGDRFFKQSLDILLGRAKAYESRPTRYYYPGLPHRDFYEPEDFAWTSGVSAASDDIQAELRALLSGREQAEAGFSPYVEAGGREGTGVYHPLQDNADWSAFYLIKQGKRIEENIARCPRTMAAIDAIGADGNPAPAPSVLFSALKPGARIPPHHGMVNTRLICHLPVILPGQCGFRVGNTTREWKPGEIFLFDDTIEHEAWNRSGQPRYVLIWEVWRPELKPRQRQLIADLFKAFSSSAVNE